MAAPQSTFVTIIAWLMIIFSGLSAFVGVLQSIFVAVAMPMPPMSEADFAGLPAEISSTALLIFQNFTLIVFANTAFSILALVAAIGLLKRREWGRRIVIALFILTAVGVVLIAVAQQAMFQWMLGQDQDLPPDAKSLFLTMRIAFVVFAAVIVAAHAWVALRLNSAAIRAEFS